MCIFVCMNVFAPLQTRRGHQIPWHWKCRWLWAVWVLGSELRSLAGAVCANILMYYSFSHFLLGKTLSKKCPNTCRGGLQKPSDIFVFIGPEQKNTAQNTGMSEGGVLSKGEGWWVSTGATQLGELWLLSPRSVHCSSRERHAGSHFPLGGLDLGLFSSTLLAPVCHREQGTMLYLSVIASFFFSLSF